MTPRSIRRAAERKAVKAARKSARLQGDGVQPDHPTTSFLRTGPTGPRTPEGKAKSSMNNLRHGLTGKFRVLAFESQSEYDELLACLRQEHQPGTTTEAILVSRMAEHFWLSRRAQNMQDDAILSDSPQKLALFLRYQTTNDRGFYKCISELRSLRKFVSQNAKTPEKRQSSGSPNCEKPGTAFAFPSAERLRKTNGYTSRGKSVGRPTVFPDTASHCAPR